MRGESAIEVASFAVPFNSFCRLPDINRALEPCAVFYANALANYVPQVTLRSLYRPVAGRNVAFTLPRTTTSFALMLA